MINKLKSIIFSPSFSHYWIGFFIVVSCLITYGQLIQGYFATDEWWAFSFAISHPSWQEIVQPAGVYAPGSNLLIAWLYRTFGVNAFLWAVLTLLIHTLNSLLVYALIFRLSNHKITALLTAIVFAVAPMGSQFVHQFSMLPTAGVATFLGLIGLIFYSYRFSILSACLILLALCFAPYALPFILFTFLLEIGSFDRKNWFRSLKSILPVLIVLGAYYLIQHFLVLSAVNLEDRPVVGENGLGAKVWFIGQKLYQSFGEIIYNQPNQINPKQMLVASNWVTLITALSLSYFYWKKRWQELKLTIIGYLWVPSSLALFSTLNTVALDATFPSRYFYLATIGASLLVAGIISGWLKSEKYHDLRTIVLLATILLTLLYFSPKTQSFVEQEVKLGQTRRMILETIKQKVPTVRRDAVFCFTSNTGHYGTAPEDIPLPFVHNFGFNLAVTYRADQPTLGLFKENPYFVAPASSYYYLLRDQKDPDGIGPGIGFGANLKGCSEVKRRFDYIAIDDFYGFAYDGVSLNLSDITPALRQYLQGQTVESSELFPWTSLTD